MGTGMLLEIENFGSINKADLDIKKINVIVGKNSTGKSTSSKFLYCLLTSLSSEGIYIANMDIKNRLNRLHYLLKCVFEDETINSNDLNPIEDLLKNLLQVSYSIIFVISYMNYLKRLIHSH